MCGGVGSMWRLDLGLLPNVPAAVRGEEKPTKYGWRKRREEINSNRGNICLTEWSCT